MTFRGLHEHSLDSKDRITVPSQYRGALSEGIVLIQGIEPSVEIWPASAAEKMEAKALSALNPMSRDARRIQRRFFAHSQATELDSASATPYGAPATLSAMNRSRCCCRTSWCSTPRAASSR